MIGKEEEEKGRQSEREREEEGEKGKLGKGRSISKMEFESQTFYTRTPPHTQAYTRIQLTQTKAHTPTVCGNYMEKVVAEWRKMQF